MPGRLLGLERTLPPVQAGSSFCPCSWLLPREASGRSCALVRRVRQDLGRGRFGPRTCSMARGPHKERPQSETEAVGGWCTVGDGTLRSNPMICVKSNCPEAHCPDVQGVLFYAVRQSRQLSGTGASRHRSCQDRHSRLATISAPTTIAWCASSARKEPSRQAAHHSTECVRQLENFNRGIHTELLSLTRTLNSSEMRSS